MTAGGHPELLPLYDNTAMIYLEILSKYMTFFPNKSHGLDYQGDVLD